MASTTDDTIRQHVAEHYGGRVARFLVDAESLPLVATPGASCCGTSDTESACCAPGDTGAIDRIAALYRDDEVADLPASVTDVSFGCGNPTAIAALQPGESVLDLGSGGGIDCFLAAKMVGPSGRVYGVDMTPEMVRLARRNAETVGATNVEFRLGEIEHLPIADASIDVIISNCVINLSPDKDQVFREAFRVLRPGGRLQVSDIVWTQPVPDAVKGDMEQWAGCIAGALLESDYLATIEAAGFVDVSSTTAAYEGGKGIASASVLATKPATA